MGFFLRKSWLWWLLAALLAWFITWLICRWRGRGDAAASAGNDAELRTARGLVDTHKAKADELTKARAADDKQLTQLKAQVGELTGQLDTHKARVTELEAGAAAAGGLAAELESHKAKVATLTSDLDAQKARAAELEVELARRPKPAPPLDLAAAGATIGAPVKMDDLAVVEGIGPKIAELLHRNGINTWAELSRTEPDRLNAILQEGGPSFRVANTPDSWPHQAALLASGRWSDFKNLTDMLIDGRYVSTSRAGAGGSSASGAATAAATPLVAKPVPTAAQLAEGSSVIGAKVALDDLKVVEGIGPAIEQLLHGGGINTWRQLEDAPVDRLREILQAAGSRFQMHEPATWPRQAGLLADAKWAEFKTLTDELDGGREG